MKVKQRNNIIRQIAQRHVEGLAYQSDYWRVQYAYWLRQVRGVAQA